MQNYADLAAAQAAGFASGTPLTSAASSTWNGTQQQFGNSLNDLGGAAPSHPTAAQWDALGPFGHTALQFTLGSAGYNWAPYAEQMLADWRQSGQQAPSGLSGSRAQMTTPLGYEAYTPVQKENLQQDAELFGPYSDYQARQARTWQPNTRSTVNA